MIYVSFSLHLCIRSLLIYVSFSDVLRTQYAPQVIHHHYILTIFAPAACSLLIHVSFSKHVCARRPLPAACSLMIDVSFSLHVCVRPLLIYVSFSDVLRTSPMCTTSDTSLATCLCLPPVACRPLPIDSYIILTCVAWPPAQYAPPVIHYCLLPTAS